VWCQLDGRQVHEGQLRVHWGIRSPICFKQKDESPAPMKARHSLCVPGMDGYDVQKVSDGS